MSICFVVLFCFVCFLRPNPRTTEQDVTDGHPHFEDAFLFYRFYFDEPRHATAEQEERDLAALHATDASSFVDDSELQCVRRVNIDEC